MSCPNGYTKIDIPIPPYYMCLPVATPTVTKTVSVTKPTKCYNAYAPVLAVYNTQMPLIYQTIAFTFDIYTERISPPSAFVTGKKKPTVPAIASVSVGSILDKLGDLVVRSVRKSFGRVPVKVAKINKVFEPICEVSYAMMKVVGNVGVRAVIRPVAISSDPQQLSVYISAGILGDIHQPTKATTFNIIEVPVQFITSPDELNAFINTLIGE